MDYGVGSSIRIVVPSENHFSPVECFGVLRRGDGLDAADAEQRIEQIFSEPVFVTLRNKTLLDMVSLLSANSLVEVYEYIRGSEITVIFRNLVFENHVISERIPGELRNESMILMEIIPKVRKDEIGGKIALQLFKRLLDRWPGIGKEPVTEVLHLDRRFSRPAKEKIGRSLRFPGSFRGTAEDNPTDLEIAVAIQQRQESTTTSDFDVVRMRAEAQDSFWSTLELDTVHRTSRGC